MKKLIHVHITVSFLILVVLFLAAIFTHRYSLAPVLVPANEAENAENEDVYMDISSSSKSFSERVVRKEKTKEKTRETITTGEVSLEKPATPKNTELGIWIWESPLQMSEARETEFLNEIAKNKMTVAYVTVDDYLDIASLSAGPDKDNAKEAYFDALADFVRNAHERGIQVDAEGGAKNWSMDENRWKGYALIDFVKEYNRSRPGAKVRNLQYDVEPYLLPAYETNKEEILLGFIEFIDESARRMQDVDAGFSVVIPHFYDAAQKWTPKVVYNGTEKHTFSHLLSVLEKKPRSDLIVMAYRNFFDGDNGVKKISEAEIQEASSGGFKTRIIVAQETGNVPPSYVTFYGRSRTELFQALSDIDNHFSPYRSFGGAAVHYVDSFLDLR
ncbi:MAG: hypothetical protein HYT94_04735 [Parcubacteria group bacterium]|nr:hypothetical protein [Parcubacteria group bacterium]